MTTDTTNPDGPARAGPDADADRTPTPKPTTTAMTAPEPATADAGRPRRRGGPIARWWVLVSRPMSLRAAWRLSGVVDATRVPGGSPVLAAVWWWSNRTDRLVLFALAILAPAVATGPLLWCAARPSRRWGLYVVLAGLLVVFRVAGG